MEVMEIQEAIMELEFDYDESSFNQAMQQANHLENELQKEVNSILRGYDDEKTTLEELKKVKDFYLKKKYLWRIKENLNRFAPALKEA